jgi:hypothetical protein
LQAQELIDMLPLEAQELLDVLSLRAWELVLELRSLPEFMQELVLDLVLEFGWQFARICPGISSLHENFILEFVW